MSDDEEEPQKKGNILPLWGNLQTMNINNLIITNIQGSPYFKNELYKLKTFHEVIDEIFYKVEHLEPWERGSRKTHGQVGMCGGVRGVGAGGIVSSAYCLLFKLFTLKLTERQLVQLINHRDSPYIRGLGFMFIRYCQPPNTFWDWLEPYLEDDEEIDPKAGGGSQMTIGQMIRSFLLKPDWYSTLFPRIPVPIHKDINARLCEMNLDDERKVYADEGRGTQGGEADDAGRKNPDGGGDDDEKKKKFGEAERRSNRDDDDKGRESSSSRRKRSRSRDRSTSRRRSRDRSGDRSKKSESSRRRSRSKESRSRRSRSREPPRRDRDRRDRSRDRSSKERSSKKTSDRPRDERRREKRRSRSTSRSRR